MQTQPQTAPRVHFDPGNVTATPGVLDALKTAGDHAIQFLARHLRGDWGDVDQADWQANDHALTNRGRLLSAYTLSDGTQIWIVTEADRSSTCLLLPDEY